jgi:hypothetical protein
VPNPVSGSFSCLLSKGFTVLAIVFKVFDHFEVTYLCGKVKEGHLHPLHVVIKFSHLFEETCFSTLSG